MPEILQISNSGLQSVDFGGDAGRIFCPTTPGSFDGGDGIEVLPRAVVAQDLLATVVTAVSLDEDVSSALRKFRMTMREELPIVAAPDSKRVIGVLSRHQVLVAYHDRVLTQQTKS